MSNKFVILFSTILITVMISCTREFSKNEISDSDMDKILQEFTQSRIDQYLYSDENPRDNLSILMMVLNRHNYNYNLFIDTLKKTKPGLYESLAGKIQMK